MDDKQGKAIVEIGRLLAGAAGEHIRELKAENARLWEIVERMAAGIMNDEVWSDDWCPVCHEHPSHDHGGKDCPMKTLAAAQQAESPDAGGTGEEKT